MVYFPIRKCYHVAKITLLMILVFGVLALFEQWRGGKRGSSAFSEPLDVEYEKEILEDEARIIPELGDGGAAAYLTGEEKIKGEESEKKLAMNVFLSDKIPYNRTLKDYRNPACQRVVYDAELPSASVILIFHNEPYSVVVRTIWSVVNSCRRDQPWFKNANFIDRNGNTMKMGYPGQDPTSQYIYLKEIILVDDNSTLPELKGKLSHYVRTRLPPDLIRILRLPDRQGLMLARMRGARAARGDVLIFLDAHCEGEPDWMRPLLQRVRDKRDAVVTPIIDVIDQSTFQLDAAEVFQVGGFTFTGHFTWIDIPEREMKRRGSDIAPTWSPTMAGGLFAMNREYYWELGAYDEQMQGWGGENLEMSFRIWQCGGTLETVPCSRVGHVFRSFHPYGMPAHTDTHGINTARMAEVWMDEYAELFYLHRPDLRNNAKIGDVTHRKVLREKLKCKSFQWFLDNIYKEKFVPVRDAYGYGRFKNPATGLCIDNLQREGDGVALGLYPCHNELAGSQHFSLSLVGELRDEDSCAQLQYHRTSGEGKNEDGVKVLMYTCRGKQKERKWRYIPSTGQIQETGRALCLEAGGAPQADLLARRCREVDTQRWSIDYAEHNHFGRIQDGVPDDQQLRLERLRGQRRKSRSLMSVDEEKKKEPQTRRKSRSHKKHKKRSGHTKNKFILKLFRQLNNNSEEHLEVDIHCKHKQLYPNNTFVRDLVTILNDRNIKVINNGRVFEKNKVSHLKNDKVLNKLELPQLPEPQRIERHEPKVEQQLSGRHEPKVEEQLSERHEPKVEQQLSERHEPKVEQLLSERHEPKIEQQHSERHEPKIEQQHLERHEPKVEQQQKQQKVTPKAALRHWTTAPPPDHRIIIEDFVELTQQPHLKRERTKKRRRRPAAPPPPPPPPPPPATADSADVHRQRADVNVLFESSEREQNEATFEEAAVSDSDRQRDSQTDMSDADGQPNEIDLDKEDDENWPVGETRYRRTNSSPPWRRDDTDEGDVKHEGSPVQLVMRSNLTFHLDDEFFNFNTKDIEDGKIPQELKQDDDVTSRQRDVTSPAGLENRRADSSSSESDSDS